MTKRRVAGSVLIAVLIMTIAGCDYAKVGAKCKASAPLPRDATHVLYCKNGKWARLVTVEQATQFIIGTLPGSSSVLNPAPVTGIVGGGAFAIDVKVLRRNGNPAGADTNVEVSGPASGASVVGTATGKTDSSGVAHIPLTTSGGLGSYDLTVKVNGAPDLKVPAQNIPNLTTDNDRNARPIKVGQLKSIFFKATDAKGTPLAGLKVDFDNIGAIVVPSAVTGADGQASADFTVGGKAGEYAFSGHAAGASAEAHLNITRGDPASLQVGGSLSITVPRNVVGTIPTITVLDAGGNPVPGVTLLYVNLANGPISSSIFSTNLMTDATGSVPTNGFLNTGVAGTFQIRAGISGTTVFTTWTITVT